VNPFLSLLHSISAGLADTELSAMKFLCRDRIRKRKLETVQSGRELFTILMEQQEIASDKLEFLRKLLQHIGRDDLVSQLVQFEEEEPHAPGDHPDVHENRLLKAATAVICDNVGREWKKLMRELGMPEVKLDRIEAAHRFDLYEKLVQALREWQRWKGKDAKVADLIKALRDCNLNLVADMVEE
ncbi:FADD protein, partial [Pardalotus punctatus]|nr:FADD protein [Pardalotus punctatus]